MTVAPHCWKWLQANCVLRAGRQVLYIESSSSIFTDAFRERWLNCKGVGEFWIRKISRLHSSLNSQVFVSLHFIWLFESESGLRAQDNLFASAAESKVFLSLIIYGLHQHTDTRSAQEAANWTFRIDHTSWLGMIPTDFWKDNFALSYSTIENQSIAILEGQNTITGVLKLCPAFCMNNFANDEDLIPFLIMLLIGHL